MQMSRGLSPVGAFIMINDVLLFAAYLYTTSAFFFFSFLNKSGLQRE